MHFSKLLLFAISTAALLLPRQDPTDSISDLLDTPEYQCAIDCKARYNNCFASRCCELPSCGMGDQQSCEEFKSLCAAQGGKCSCLPQCANLGTGLWLPECKC
ncbi:hypothetical protein P152DRAFT_453130 [Eremomyces bilateralis CBS 781.70]|uniref:Uncharacterized protein n=1 Tax=Eremomyces bilateralis CBS 781.70 TaxID=1392243 RepID=A0A6G1FQP6_9PEZI|nr:uncharacterized protein P152DRAFT_453130 [Eremomyces bilateralis CBS 781.70]KAF1808117.1 hypothetical protein P152DRAFT_453130 [Eremomyces bilateralis CBS 781.70]